MKKKLLIGLILLFTTSLFAQGQFGLGFKKSRLRMSQIYSDSLFTITLRADSLRGWNQDTVYVNSRLILNEGITIRQTVDNEFMVTSDGDTIRLNAYRALKAFQIEIGDVDQAWIDTTGIGYLRSKLGINTITPDDQVEIVNAAANAVLDLTAYHDTEATTPLISLRKAEGTEASHGTPVDDNAVLGTLSFKGYDTDGWIEGAKIQAIASGTPADNVMPTDLEFYTNTGGATATLVWTIEEDGDLTSNLATGILMFAGATANKILCDADALTFGGVNGATNNEDIVWDFETTANEIAVSSNTSMDNIDFASIELQTDEIGTDSGNLSATPVGTFIVNADDAAAGTNKTYMTISGTTPAHGSGTPTDIWLNIDPTIGTNTNAANAHLID